MLNACKLKVILKFLKQQYFFFHKRLNIGSINLTNSMESYLVYLCKKKQMIRGLNFK